MERNYKNNKIMKVKFKVTKIIDIRKTGSSLELNNIYIGQKDAKRKDIIWWEDPANGQEWVFYIGDTCELVEDIEQEQNIVPVNSNQTTLKEAYEQLRLLRTNLIHTLYYFNKLSELPSEDFKNETNNALKHIYNRNVEEIDILLRDVKKLEVDELKKV